MRGGEDHRSKDGRGSNKDRKARRAWLLSHYGDGSFAPCFWCGSKLDNASLQVDRWPICGHDGGRYTRDNIVPSCGTCNGSRCSKECLNAQHERTGT